MKVIVAGGRDFDDYSRLSDVLFSIPRPFEVVSGGAKGADTLAIEWATEYNAPLKVFRAAWDAHGKAAGILRNIDMAEYADTLVAFWDGQSKGTRHMIDVALSSGLEIHVYRYTND